MDPDATQTDLNRIRYGRDEKYEPGEIIFIVPRRPDQCIVHHTFRFVGYDNNGFPYFHIVGRLNTNNNNSIRWSIDHDIVIVLRYDPGD